MVRVRLIGFVLLALLCGVGGAAALAGGEPTPEEAEHARLEKAYLKAFDAHDYASARSDLRRLIEIDPNDKFLRYNLACADSMLGKTHDAVEALLDALARGFVDFHHMERDKNLDSIRSDSRYQTIVSHWRLLLDKRAEAELKAMKKAFGPEYTFEQDPERRLIWISAFDKAGFASAKKQVALVYDWAKELFAEPAPDPDKPDPWVQVILPTTGDFLRLIGAGRIGGYYDKDNKRLVSRDIGPSLRHEFFHVLHWRHMARVGQTHPIWLQEGLACLLEDVDEGSNGTLTIRPSWRTNIAKRLAKMGALMPWERLFTMDHREFVEHRPRATYAQARAVVMFLEERGKLVEWYRTYVKGYDEDPTGIKAMETVFGEPSEAVQREYRKWLLGLEQVADIDRPGPSLGVALSQGSGDGPKVDEIVALNPGGIGGETGHRLRYRDVIVAIDGRTVRTLDDLTRVLGDYEVGDQVVVTVHRGRVTRKVPVTLVAPEE